MFTLRDLRKEDSSMLLQLLGGLTETPLIPPERLTEIFDVRVRSGVITKVATLSASNQIIGTASLLIEQKYIHGGRCVGHIEDVVTDSSFRGKGVAGQLLRALHDVAKSKNCYKLILSCSDENRGYYEKNGFHRDGCNMRLDV